MSIYDKLNEPQREAVYHTDGPLLILAGAGSGKTRVLTHRIAYLIGERGVNPWNILAITFTNKAAEEMRQRVDNLVGFGAESVWVSTFHSACVRILRRFIDRLGYENHFTIYDTDDQKTLIKEVCRKVDVDTKVFKERSLLSAISSAKNEMILPDEFELNAGGDFAKMKIAKVYREYEAQMRANNALDFDDLLVKTVQLLQTQPDVLESYQERFRYIMVDEYQDTNEAQDLLFTYLSNGHNLFTVGDIKQSIYRFRLAMPNIFNDKRKRYAIYDEKDSNISSKIILDKNFRSSKGICDYVNFVFSHLMSEKVGEINYDKQDWLNYGAKYEKNDAVCAQINIIDKVKGEETNKLEALQIAKLIKEKVENKEQIKDGDTYRNIRYSDFAVLFRKMKNIVEDYVEVFTDMAIPVVCDNSSSLFESNEIKIILSFLRTIDNPTKEISLISTMMSPIYGFTPDELAEIRIENLVIHRMYRHF